MRKLLRLMAIGPMLITAQNAYATPVSFSFSGTIAMVGADVDVGTFSIGQNVSGSFTFESTTPDSDSNTEIGRYDNTISNVDFAFGSYAGTAGPGSILTRNDFSFSFGTFDSYEARGIAATGADVNGRVLQTFNLQLLDDTLTMLSSDALPDLPLTPFRNDNSNTTFLILQFDPISSSNIVSGQIRATVDSIMLASRIPEPGSLQLLGAAIVGFWLARRKRVC